MNPEVEKIIKERLGKLPQNVSAGIQSIPWLEKVKEIAGINRLHGDEAELLVVETALIVLGVEPSSNYPENLSQKVGLSDDQVIKIAKEVDEKIITPIIKAIGNTKSSIPEIAPEIHPMVGTQVKMRPTSGPVMILNKEDVKQMISPKPNAAPASTPTPPNNVSLPDYRYDGGADPYREPLK